MISWNYVIKNFRDHARFTLFAAFVLILFQFLIVTLIASIDIQSAADALFRQLPPEARLFLQQEFLGDLTTNGLIGFAYNHPIVLILFAIIAITIPGKHIAGEIEGGTLELLFAMPVKRKAIAFSLWCLCGLLLLILLTSAWLGTIIGLLVHPAVRSANLMGLVRVGFNLWLLMLAVSSYSLLFSAFSRAGGTATSRAAGLTLIFYFLVLAGKLWKKIAFIQPLSLFTYYQPQALMVNASGMMTNTLVLAAISLISAAIAIRHIELRDIPG